jgi:hypothetical protein
LEQLITTMTDHMAHVTRALGAWVQAAPRDLQEIEQHVLRIVKELGATLLAGLTSLLAPAHSTPSVPCPCGHSASYLRQRPATVTTILGPITIQRPYYLCARCGHGQHPLDAQLGLCAGGRSAGLDELLALLGATQDSFADAIPVLDRLTLLHTSPNSVRAATEELGAVLVAEQAKRATTAEEGYALPAADAPPPQRLYITMDGVLAHLHDPGWSELKVGCCYQTHAGPAHKRPGRMEIRAHSLSYVTAHTEAQTFGWQVWQEAARRGVLEADEVVVVGDGAHWIWNIADTHFPGATQILDWYHASEYIWEAASAVWGEVHPQRAVWAHRQLDALWDGKVEQVLGELEQQQDAGEGVRAALSYYTTHRGRMDYASYRARGLQIGSGSVESGCKQLVTARLKGAGMIWDAEGAEAVAAVRAWLKSGRWEEAMALRPARGRTYERHQGQAGAEREASAAAPTVNPAAVVPVARGLSPEVLATLRAEAARDKEQPHGWRKAWSVKQQRAQHTQRTEHARTTKAA